MPLGHRDLPLALRRPPAIAPAEGPSSLPPRHEHGGSPLCPRSRSPSHSLRGRLVPHRPPADLQPPVGGPPPASCSLGGSPLLLRDRPRHHIRRGAIRRVPRR